MMLPATESPAAASEPVSASPATRPLLAPTRAPIPTPRHPIRSRPRPRDLSNSRRIPSYVASISAARMPRIALTSFISDSMSAARLSPMSRLLRHSANESADRKLTTFDASMERVGRSHSASFASVASCPLLVCPDFRRASYAASSMALRPTALPRCSMTSPSGRSKICPRASSSFSRLSRDMAASGVPRQLLFLAERRRSSTSFLHSKSL